MHAAGQLFRFALVRTGSGIWGFRLTYNFWIKGGFSGGEENN